MSARSIKDGCLNLFSTFRRWRSSWILILLASLFFSLVFVYQMRTLVSIQASLEISDLSINHAVALQKLVLDAETGLRGYLLTSDYSLLDPFFSERQMFHSLFDQTVAITEDSAQKHQLHLLESAFSQWTARANEVTTIRNTCDDATAFFGSGKGRLLIDQCRNAINAFLSAEELQHEHYSQMLKRKIPRVIYGGAALVLFLRILLMMSYHFFRSRYSPQNLTTSGS